MLFVLTGCIIDPYSIRAKRMSVIDFCDSTWKSEEPPIYLEVDKNGEAFGYLLYNSEKIEVEYAVDWGQFFMIYKKSLNNHVKVNDYIIEGTCKCTEQKVVITVDKDYLFGGQYPVIILERVE